MQSYSKNYQSFESMTTEEFYSMFDQSRDVDDSCDNSALTVGYQYKGNRKGARFVMMNVWRYIKDKIVALHSHFKIKTEWSRSTFYMFDSLGQKRKCHSICTIDSMSMRDGESKIYVVYADGSKDNAGNINLYVAEYNSQASNNEYLVPIIDFTERHSIESLVADIKSSIGDQLNQLPF